MSARPIGINTYAYAWTTPAADAVRRLAELGYRSFELLIHPPHLPLDEFAKSKIAITNKELVEERDAVKSMLPACSD